MFDVRLEISACSSRRRRGYSFPEVMFAVVVLGIGFIMLAAVFPVAIKQSKMTSDETRGVAIGREAAGLVQNLARGTDATYTDWRRTIGNLSDPKFGSKYDPNYSGPRTMPKPPDGDELPLHIGRSLFPPTGENYANKKIGEAPPLGHVRPVWTLFGWDLLRGNMIVPTDNRYAWTILYKRDGDPTDDPTQWSPLVQLYVIVANARTRDLYDIRPTEPDIWQDWHAIKLPAKPPVTVDVAPYSTANLYPRFVQVRFENDYLNTGGAGPDRMVVVPAAGNSVSLPGALAEGCYVVTEGTVSGVNLRNQAGRVYRLGAEIPETGELDFALLPGSDMKSATENTVGNFEWIMCLGREWDPRANSGQGEFKGPAQDIYLYTTMISIVPKK